MNGDGLRCIEGIFKDKFHIFSRTQAGVEEMLGGNGLAQHVGNSLCLTALFLGFYWMKFSPELDILVGNLIPKKNGQG